jgi:hypothetical protein
MVKDSGYCDATEKRNPHGQRPPVAENLVGVQFDPRGLAFPLLVIEPSDTRCKNASASRSCLTQTTSPRLSGQIGQNHAGKPASIFGRDPRKQLTDSPRDINAWLVIVVRLVDWYRGVSGQRSSPPNTY